MDGVATSAPWVVEDEPMGDANAALGDAATEAAVLREEADAASILAAAALMPQGGQQERVSPNLAHNQRSWSVELYHGGGRHKSPNNFFGWVYPLCRNQRLAWLEMMPSPAMPRMLHPMRLLPLCRTGIGRSEYTQT
jgi:hypothetical protein